MERRSERGKRTHSSMVGVPVTLRMRVSWWWSADLHVRSCDRSGRRRAARTVATGEERPAAEHLGADAPDGPCARK